MLKKTSLLCLSLLLSACNLTVYTTGEGQISAQNDSTMLNDECGESKYCFDISRGKQITLSATPSPGFRFIGWSGACEGQGSTCSISINADTEVQATFQRIEPLQSAPLMVPNTLHFFSAPWPNDLYSLTDKGTIKMDHFPFDANTPFTVDIKQLASETQGFGLNSAAYFQWDNPEWLETLQLEEINTLPPEQRNGILLNVDPSSPQYGKITPALLKRNTNPDTGLDTDGLLAVLPQPGYSLLPNTEYAALIIRNDYMPGALPASLINDLNAAEAAQASLNNPLFDHFKSQQQRIWQVVSEHTDFQVENILAFTLYTTQDPLSLDRMLGDTIASYTDQELMNMVKHIQPMDLENTIYREEGCYEGFILETELPNYLTGNGLHFFTGGAIKTRDGKALQQGVTPSNILVTKPCEAPPEEGFPLRAHASSTGEAWRQDTTWYFQKNIHLWLNAPETAERTTPVLADILAWFENNTNTEAELIKNAFIDFNFLNLYSANNRHHQYAADLNTVLRIGKLLPTIIEQRGAVEAPYLNAADFEFNPDAVTLSGYSLGGIAAIMAATQQATEFTSIATWSAPRASYLHIENLTSLVGGEFENLISAYTGAQIGNHAQPQQQLLQTVLEPMDIINHVPSIQDKDIYWLLSDYDDLLHGGPSGYSMATAFEQHTRIRGLYYYSWSNIQLQSRLSRELLSSDHLFDPQTENPLQIVAAEDRDIFFFHYFVYRCFSVATTEQSPFYFDYGRFDYQSMVDCSMMR